MKSTRVLAVAAAAVLVTGAAVRAEEKAPAAPRPAPEMAQLKMFEHNWTCTGQANASSFGPAHKTVTKVHGHADLGGFWVSGRVEESKTAESPMPMDGMFHMTWDAGNKQFLLLWVDNTGGWAQQTSPGWNGDTMVWSGDGWMGGQKLGARDTFTKKGAEELEHTWELDLNGQWTPLGQETCKAAASSTGHMMKR